MPWEKQYRESEVLDRAMRAFWAGGYSDTSIGDLVRVTGINRGSLYAAYDGKRSLFIAALVRYDRLHCREFLRRFAEKMAPKDSIIAVFDAAANAIPDEKTPAGCLLVNTALELSPHDEEIAKFIRSSFASVEKFFADQITSAQRDDTVRQDLSADETAKVLFGLLLGLRVLARAGADQPAKHAITEQVRQLLS